MLILKHEFRQRAATIKPIASKNVSVYQFGSCTLNAQSSIFLGGGFRHKEEKIAWRFSLTKPASQTKRFGFSPAGSSGGFRQP